MCAKKIISGCVFSSEMKLLEFLVNDFVEDSIIDAFLSIDLGEYNWLMYACLVVAPAVGTIIGVINGPILRILKIIGKID